MNRIFRALRPFAMLLCCALLLASCSNLNTIKFKNEEYHDSKNDITYRQAPLNYEAVKIADKAVARVKKSVGDDILLYPVDGMETEQMLANDLYEIFYADGITLPNVWDMGIREIYICKTQTISAQLATIDTEKDVDEILALYRYGTGISKNKISMEQASDHYYLKFVSTTHPYLYYCLEYLTFSQEVIIYESIANTAEFTPKYQGVTVTFEDYEYTENGETFVEHLAAYHFGTGILYDRASGICYAAGSLINPYLNI